MKSLLAAFFLIFYCSTLFPQFSLEKFLDEPFDHSMTSVRDSCVDIKLIEKEVMNYKAILYYDWIEPFSIKVGYLFNKDGHQKGKMIANGKIEDAEKFLIYIKEVLLKKIGSNFSENSMLGLTMLMWNGVKEISVMLTSSEDKTALIILKK